MDAFYQDDYVTLYEGNANKLVWTLDQHYDAVITDPPYIVQATDNDWGKQQRHIREIRNNNLTNGFDFAILDLLKAYTQPTNMMFFCSHDQIYDYLRWGKRNDINWQLLFWHKPHTVPIPAGGSYLFDTEYIVHFYQSLPAHLPIHTYFILNTIRSMKYDHPTIKPLKIVTELIRHITEPGALVLDPFAGTGTTCACAKALGRRSIGIEILPKYLEMAKDRCIHTPANSWQADFLGEG